MGRGSKPQGWYNGICRESCHVTIATAEGNNVSPTIALVDLQTEEEISRCVWIEPLLTKLRSLSGMEVGRRGARGHATNRVLRIVEASDSDVLAML